MLTPKTTRNTIVNGVAWPPSLLIGHQHRYQRPCLGDVNDLDCTQCEIVQSGESRGLSSMRKLVFNDTLPCTSKEVVEHA